MGKIKLRDICCSSCSSETLYYKETINRNIITCVGKPNFRKFINEWVPIHFTKIKTKVCFEFRTRESGFSSSAEITVRHE